VILALLVLLVALNCVAVDGFGEVEYWLSLTKILAIIFFIFVSIYVVASGGGGFYMYDMTVERYREINPSRELTGDAGGAFLGANAGTASLNILSMLCVNK
jgi:amino acid permease